MLIPRRDFPQDLVFSATIRCAPGKKADLIANASFVQRKSALRGRAQMPDHEHGRVEVPCLRASRADRGKEGVMMLHALTAKKVWEPGIPVQESMSTSLGVK